MSNNSTTVININGSNNKSALILDSSNATITNDNTELINSYVTSIQNYIQDQLNLVLTDMFRTNNNLTGEKGFYTNNVKLCWVGEPETFYNDINIHISNPEKIFTHFSDSEKSNYILNFQDACDNIIDVPLNLSASILNKINYVNKYVPNNLKLSAQGYHTLGCINNSTRIDNSEPQIILNSKGFGIKKYYEIYAYEETTYDNLTLDYENIQYNLGTGTVQLDLSGNRYVQIGVSSEISYGGFYIEPYTFYDMLDNNDHGDFAENPKRYLNITGVYYIDSSGNQRFLDISRVYICVINNGFITPLLNNTNLSNNSHSINLTTVGVGFGALPSIDTQVIITGEIVIVTQT
tara:strand:- start:3720 stop:4766 length:1047 start_codon:yes stop_codon:yes gene_type:complete